MTNDTFKALVVREDENQDVTFALEDTQLDQLSAGDVVVKVAYSSINYKDMLAVQKNGGVIRNYPMIPGIDFSGVVVASDSPTFTVGQKVLATSFAIGVSHTGGFAEFVRVKSDWLIPLPDGLSLKSAMAFGTAGFTAALSIDALEKHGMQATNNPRLIVTGSTGGVGSIAVQMLHKAGYKNIKALIRKDYQEEVALKLGASEVIYADDLGKKKALTSRTYDYVLDTVGGEVAAKLLPQIELYGSMSACGNAGGATLDTTILPFILRGVNLLGINSSDIPIAHRREIWEKMATEWQVADDIYANVVTLDDLSASFTALKEGRHLGRTIVAIDPSL